MYRECRNKLQANFTGCPNALFRQNAKWYAGCTNKIRHFAYAQSVCHYANQQVCQGY